MPLCHNQSYQKAPHGLQTIEKSPHRARQTLAFVIALMQQEARRNYEMCCQQEINQGFKLK